MSLVIPTRLASRVPLLSPALFSRCLATEPPTSSPTPPPPASFSNPVATCRSQVERSDYDAYLASYFYPAGRHRDAFYAMRALNLELDSIEDSVSNLQIGRIRIQFWRDAIASIANGQTPPKHPIALALALTSDPKTVDLTAYYLNQVLDGREQNLLSPTPTSLLALLQSLTLTTHPLSLLSLSLLSSSTQPSHITQNSLQHLSLSLGLTRLLRAIPHHARSRKMPALPLDVLAEKGVVQENVWRKGGEAEGLKETVFEIATRANDEMMTARLEWKGEDGKMGKIPKEEMPAFLGAIPAQAYLAKLQKVDFDAFHPSLQQRHWRDPLDMWLARRKQMI